MPCSFSARFLRKIPRLAYLRNLFGCRFRKPSSLAAAGFGDGRTKPSGLRARACHNDPIISRLRDFSAPYGHPRSRAVGYGDIIGRVAFLATICSSSQMVTPVAISFSDS